MKSCPFLNDRHPFPDSDRLFQRVNIKISGDAESIVSVLFSIDLFLDIDGLLVFNVEMIANAFKG
jgi:hypothetical protein